MENGKKSKMSGKQQMQNLKKDGGIEKEKMHVDKKFAEFSFYIGKIWRYRVQSHIYIRGRVYMRKCTNF